MTVDRRAQAYENLGELKLALADYTTVCILQMFQDQAGTSASNRSPLIAIGMLAADRILKKLGEELADDHLKTSEVCSNNDTLVASQPVADQTSADAAVVPQHHPAPAAL